VLKSAVGQGNHALPVIARSESDVAISLSAANIGDRRDCFAALAMTTLGVFQHAPSTRLSVAGGDAKFEVANTVNRYL
jgi:hypothetical protein